MICFAFRGDELLVRGAAIPALDALADAGVSIVEHLRVTDDAVAAIVPDEAAAPDGFAFTGLWELGELVDRATWRLAGRAFQIVDWHRSHVYCGRCGARTDPHHRESARHCPSCRALYFPRLNPAVIVLIERGDRMLLARSPQFPPGMYSAIAGFVEPGESLEEAVAREVREEVGLEIDQLRYFGSQQWPFPSSLMLGFTARYAGGDLRLDDPEVVDARWFGADDLPVLPPPISIARSLIDAFLARHTP